LECPPLRFGHIQRKNYFNFGIAERLRAFRYPIFTGGVVEGNGSCSAAFCESAALREAAASLCPHPSAPDRGKASVAAGTFSLHLIL
jgi:hypothetical protein